jgi:hypothetical protein
LFARHVLHVRSGAEPIDVADDRPQWREMHGIMLELLDAEQRRLAQETVALTDRDLAPVISRRPTLRTTGHVTAEAGDRRTGEDLKLGDR